MRWTVARSCRLRNFGSVTRKGSVAKYLSEDEENCVIDQEVRHADCLKREAGTTKNDAFRNVGRASILPDGASGQRA